MLQQLALLLSIALILSVLAVFLFVASRTGTQSAYGMIQKRGSRIRLAVFVGLVLVATPVLVWSLSDLPYSPPGELAPAAAKRIDAVGYQWYWTVSDSSAVVGQPVEFHVTSNDVNHGFAIYDKNLRLVAQTQAMPGYDNVLHHTFAEAGTYKVLCLEYCGLAHHAMAAEIVVAQAQ